MKLSVSLPESDVEALDAFVREAGLSSRSAAVQHAIRQLRSAQLEDEYIVAWDEWAASGSAEDWEVTSADGLDEKR